MSVIPQLSGQSIVSRLYGHGTGGVVRQSNEGASPRWTDPAVISEVRLTRGDLLEMNRAGGADAGTLNALATAHDALGVIGGLLTNVSAVLGAAASGDASFDLRTDQSRVDGAVTTIDTVASSTASGGKKLLDGTFSTRTSTGMVAIPPFASTELGKDAGNGTLKSLAAGGANDLASGRVNAAGKIVAAAIRQVTLTRTAIQGVAAGSKTAHPPGGHEGEWLKSAADEMLADPAMSVVAVANSEPRTVLALIGR